MRLELLTQVIWFLSVLCYIILKSDEILKSNEDLSLLEIFNQGRDRERETNRGN